MALKCTALYDCNYGDEIDTVDVKAKRSDGVLASDAGFPRIWRARWLGDVGI